jgi:hypothetical protein
VAATAKSCSANSSRKNSPVGDCGSAWCPPTKGDVTDPNLALAFASKKRGHPAGLRCRMVTAACARRSGAASGPSATSGLCQTSMATKSWGEACRTNVESGLTWSPQLTHGSTPPEPPRVRRCDGRDKPSAHPDLGLRRPCFLDANKVQPGLCELLLHRDAVG